MHLRLSWKLSPGQATDAGRKEHNEDCIGIRIPDEPLLTTKGVVAIIADGVSSAEAGKLASETSVIGFLTDYFSTPESWTVKTAAHKVLIALNRWLWGQGHRFQEARKGYVTTLSVLILKSRTAHIFHVGDTRIYRLRERMEQLTTDHVTYVNEDTKYLSRALGLERWPEVDYLATDVREGDIFFLCTDGVHDFLQDRWIAGQLRGMGESPDACCRDIIAEALRAGSDDNLSCQAIRVEAVDAEDEEAVHRRLTELPFPPALDKGMVLDGYRILKEIHASNRSQVYLVEDTASSQRLVMKTPSVNFDDDPAYIERFIMEEWIGRRIDSPYVARVVEPRQLRSCLYYLTEYVPGITLAEWIRQNPRPDIREVIIIIEHIARGLLKFHRRETVHQDLKPKNVVLDGNGVPKIVDFGSCHVGGIAEIDSPIERDLILGTRSYSAPEQMWGQGADTRADLFSLGVICYEMLTGKPPYAGGLDRVTSPADLEQLAWVPASEHNPLVPLWMDAALRKALALRREQRYADFSEFIYDLRHPNPGLQRASAAPLAERDPLLVWKCLVAVLAASQAVTLVLLLSG